MMCKTFNCFWDTIYPDEGAPYQMCKEISCNVFDTEDQCLDNPHIHPEWGAFYCEWEDEECVAAGLYCWDYDNETMEYGNSHGMEVSNCNQCPNEPAHSGQPDQCRFCGGPGVGSPGGPEDWCDDNQEDLSSSAGPWGCNYSIDAACAHAPGFGAQCVCPDFDDYKNSCCCDGCQVYNQQGEDGMPWCAEPGQSNTSAGWASYGTAATAHDDYCQSTCDCCCCAEEKWTCGASGGQFPSDQTQLPPGNWDYEEWYPDNNCVPRQIGKCCGKIRPTNYCNCENDTNQLEYTEEGETCYKPRPWHAHEGYWGNPDEGPVCDPVPPWCLECNPNILHQYDWQGVDLWFTQCTWFNNCLDNTQECPSCGEGLDCCGHATCEQQVDEVTGEFISGGYTNCEATLDCQGVCNGNSYVVPNTCEPFQVFVPCPSSEVCQESGVACNYNPDSDETPCVELYPDCSCADVQQACGIIDYTRGIIGIPGTSPRNTNVEGGWQWVMEQIGTDGPNGTSCWGEAAQRGGNSHGWFHCSQADSKISIDAYNHRYMNMPIADVSQNTNGVGDPGWDKFNYCCCSDKYELWAYKWVWPWGQHDAEAYFNWTTSGAHQQGFHHGHSGACTGYSLADLGDDSTQDDYFALGELAIASKPSCYDHCSNFNMPALAKIDTVYYCQSEDENWRTIDICTQTVNGECVSWEQEDQDCGLGMITCADCGGQGMASTLDDVCPDWVEEMDGHCIDTGHCTNWGGPGWEGGWWPPMNDLGHNHFSGERFCQVDVYVPCPTFHMPSAETMEEYCHCIDYDYGDDDNDGSADDDSGGGDDGGGDDGGGDDDDGGGDDPPPPPPETPQIIA